MAGSHEVVISASWWQKVMTAYNFQEPWFCIVTSLEFSHCRCPTRHCTQLQANVHFGPNFIIWNVARATRIREDGAEYCAANATNVQNLDNTNSIELSPSCKAASCEAPQVILNILWNLKVHCRAYKSHPPVSVLSHISPVRTNPHSLSKIHFNIIQPHTSWSS
jgi:hypothetical protein